MRSVATSTDTPTAPGERNPFGRVLALVFLLGCSSLAVAQNGAVVFGSWVNPEFTEAARARVAKDFGITARTTETTVNGRRYFRLLSDSMSEHDARHLVTRARAAGHPAWYLAGAGTTPVWSPPEIAAAPSSAAPPRRANSATAVPPRRDQLAAPKAATAVQAPHSRSTPTLGRTTQQRSCPGLPPAKACQ